MADITREELEKMALEAAPAFYYYELLDTLDETPDKDLWAIINGDFPKDEDAPPASPTKFYIRIVLFIFSIAAAVVVFSNKSLIGTQDSEQNTAIHTMAEKGGSIASADQAFRLKKGHFEHIEPADKTSKPPFGARLEKICLSGVEYLYLHGAWTSGLQVNIRTDDYGAQSVSLCQVDFDYSKEIEGRLHEICLERQLYYYHMGYRSAALALKYLPDTSIATCKYSSENRAEK